MKIKKISFWSSIASIIGLILTAYSLTNTNTPSTNTNKNEDGIQVINGSGQNDTKIVVQK